MVLQVSPHPRRTIPRRSSATQTHSAFAFPSPQKGINTAQPLTAGSPLTALRLENLIPRALGCQMRRGFTRWTSNLDGEVRSLMKYQPALGVPKMFAATSTGKIYNVTTATLSGVTPAAVTTVTGGTPPGEWTSLNFVSQAGVHGLVRVNPGSGYWVYNGTTFTHVTMGAGVGQVGGVNPNLFTFVTVFKNRLWFIEGGSTRAWYLPLGQFYGAAVSFDFGAMLPNGGELAALINWTADGGGGQGSSTGGGTVNNQLVVVSDQGDVLVYGGDDASDPSLPEHVQGRWYVGRVPTGHRFFSLYGSDVIILSERGMCFMSELMRGQGFFENVGTAQAINSALAVDIAASLDSRYWEVVFLPQEQLIIINRAEINTENLQWVYEVNNRAFATLRSIPMLTVATFNGASYCGDLNGHVWWIFEGSTDGAVDDVPGLDLQAVCVTAFLPMGEGIRVKRFLMVRPSFISSSAPGVQTRLNAEWNLGAPSSVPPYLGAGENLWDVATWDLATWDGEGQSYEGWAGASGTGRYGSLAMRVRGAADTIFVGWQALVEQGGIL